MSKISRRKFVELATSFGAVLALQPTSGKAKRLAQWQERREYFPQGVASGDPHENSVILWTRRPPLGDSTAQLLRVEVSETPDFQSVVATANSSISGDTDWTTRVLAVGLKPSQVYWFRFTDEDGFGSRVGRTITAPSRTSSNTVRFAFVSCQNVTQGACNAYRRMIWEDERKPQSEQLEFVLHLGDFVYELVWYPEDRPQGMYSRRLRDLVRYRSGEKIRDFHVPTTVDDYRTVYRAYLSDPDLQDARARWPFVCMWDNHEFSWKGWQSQQNFGDVRPAQRRKVAANQAWFEYQPARVVKPGNRRDDRFDAPAVTDNSINKFDDHGVGLDPGNLAAINSLKVFRTLRYGRNVDLILTDNRSFRSEPVVDQPGFTQFQTKRFPYVDSEEIVEILDAGETYNGGRPPESIRFDGKEIPNPKLHAKPQSMIGAHQKSWFLTQLRASRATWKLWGSSVGMLDWRTDFQNLPKELGVEWPTSGYALFSADDWSGYRTERAEILDTVRREGITGFASIAGDRHSFQAGVVSKSLSSKSFEPVAVEFVTGSVSAPGLFEAAEYNIPRGNPLWPIYLQQKSIGGPIEAAMNLSIMHGVLASLELQKSGDMTRALAKTNREVSPHLSFMDVGGHGYSIVKADNHELEVEFVCIPRPLERSTDANGGPIAYRVKHRVRRWVKGTSPRLERTLAEGTLPWGS